MNARGAKYHSAEKSTVLARIGSSSGLPELTENTPTVLKLPPGVIEPRLGARHHFCRRQDVTARRA